MPELVGRLLAIDGSDAVTIDIWGFGEIDINLCSFKT